MPAFEEVPPLPSLRPDEYRDSAFSITPEHLAARGISALIIDLDNTLVGWHQTQVTPAARAWLERMRQAGIGVCIVSNNNLARVGAFVAQGLDLPYVASAGKPGKGAFHKAMALLRSTVRNTAVVGDQIFTDVLGGQRMGLYTILVVPISRGEFFGTRLITRPLERLVLRWHRLRPE